MTCPAPELHPRGWTPAAPPRDPYATRVQVVTRPWRPLFPATVPARPSGRLSDEVLRRYAAHTARHTTR